MLKLITKITAAIAVVSIALFGSANAKTLKIETHFTASSPNGDCLLYTSPSPRDAQLSRMPSSA